MRRLRQPKSLAQAIHDRQRHIEKHREAQHEQPHSERERAKIHDAHALEQALPARQVKENDLGALVDEPEQNWSPVATCDSRESPRPVGDTRGHGASSGPEVRNANKSALPIGPPLANQNPLPNLVGSPNSAVVRCKCSNDSEWPSARAGASAKPVAATDTPNSTGPLSTSP